MVQPQVHVAVLGECGQHLQPRRREPAGAEHGEPVGQVDQGRVAAQPGARIVQQLGGGRPETLAQRPPQLGLPAQVGGQRAAVAELVSTLRPRLHHRRAGVTVGVERPRERSRDGEPASVDGVAAGQVPGERGGPRRGQVGVDHLEQRPDGSGRLPPLDRGRVLGRGTLDGLVDQRRRPREPHVGAHPGPVVRAEDVREPLRQPALDALRGNGDHLGGEGVGRGCHQHLGESAREHRAAPRAVHDQHVLPPPPPALTPY